jgi:transposase
MAQGKDGRALVTRRFAASKLGVSYKTVVALQDRGKIHGHRGPDGAWLYDQAELELVRPARTTSKEGKIQAAAVRMFRDGACDADVVEQLEVTFATVREIRRQYDPNGMWLPGTMVTAAHVWLEQSGRVVSNPDELLEQLVELLARDRELASIELRRAQGLEQTAAVGASASVGGLTEAPAAVSLCRAPRARPRPGRTASKGPPGARGSQQRRRASAG